MLAVMFKASMTSNTPVGSGMIMRIRMPTMPSAIPISLWVAHDDCSQYARIEPKIFTPFR